MIDPDKKLIGEKAQSESREFLNSFGFHVQQIDWLGERDGKWVKFEVKALEPFDPPPFKGHGLCKRQVTLSRILLEQKQIRTYLLIKDLETGKWIGQYLDILEAGEHHDLGGKFDIRLYPIVNFNLAGEDLL